MTIASCLIISNGTKTKYTALKTMKCLSILRTDAMYRTLFKLCNLLLLMNDQGQRIIVRVDKDCRINNGNGGWDPASCYVYRLCRIERYHRRTH